VLIDGVDIAICGSRTFAANRIVTQQTLLFDETIYDNIRYSKRRRRAAIEAAAPPRTSTASSSAARGYQPGGPRRMQALGRAAGSASRWRCAMLRIAILILDSDSAIDAQASG